VLAFNVNTDLSYFENIVPCGIADKGVTCMAKELGGLLDMEAVKDRLKLELADLFDVEVVGAGWAKGDRTSMRYPWTHAAWHAIWQPAPHVCGPCAIFPTKPSPEK